MAKIVLVEDEAELRELIAEELEDAGHHVKTAADGVEGLELIRKTRPDVILSDINMPRLNGYQMRRELQESDPELAELPFVFISAFSDQSDISDGLVVGADHYITKPIDFDALTAWVQKVCV